MPSGLLLFAAVMFVLACWVYVIGHQLGLSGFDPVRYTILRGVLPLAYTVAGLSVCVLGLFIVGMVAKK